MSEPIRLLVLLRDWLHAVRAPSVAYAYDEAPELAGPAGLSIWDPIHLGIDENGHPVRVTLAYRNALLAGEPGAGKSVGLNCIVGHAALATDCGLWLFDGKLVELGLWRGCADRFVGPDLDDALEALGELQVEMDPRYDLLDTHRRRKITPEDAHRPRHLAGGGRVRRRARPRCPGPRGRDHRRGRDPAAVIGHHPHLAA